MSFTPSASDRYIEVWSEGTGAEFVLDVDSGRSMNDTVTYRLSANDRIFTIRYVITDEVTDDSEVMLAYRMLPEGPITRTAAFTLYARPSIQVEKYYRPTVQFKGVLDISITNGSYYIQCSMDEGELL